MSRAIHLPSLCNERSRGRDRAGLRRGEDGGWRDDTKAACGFASLCCS